MRTENPERDLRESASSEKLREREAITMSSAVISSPGVIELHSAIMPEPRKGEIRIRLEGCGICASNLPVWEGRPWFDYPLESGAPGHEGWGRVDAVGDNNYAFKTGDRVTFLSSHAFGQYDIAKKEEAVALPSELDEMPFPGEPLGCAMNIFRRSDIKSGQWVAIIGIGFLGALLTGLAAETGARVIAISRRRSSLETAKIRGAEKTILSEDSNQIIDAVKTVTGGDFCQRVIEATGYEAPLNLAAEITGIRGKLVVAGFHQDGPRQVNMQLWNWRGIDVINAHERQPAEYVRGMTEAVHAVAQGRLDYLPLLTHRYDFENISEAFQIAGARPEGFMKAIIEF